MIHYIQLNIMSEENIKDKLDNKTIYILLTIMGIVFLIGIITSLVRLSHGVAFGHDFRFFYQAVQNFWINGKNLYQDNVVSTFQIEGYFYLNYFCVLCVWMLLPLPLSFLIHLLITIIMFYLILRNIDTIYEKWWMYGNIIMVFWWATLFNTNIWIAFALFMYQKKREEWYSPLFLIFAFYKITSIIAFGILYLVNLLFEKKIRWNQFPGLVAIFIITGISYLTSVGINTINTFGTDMLLLLLQVPHYVWWTVSILAITEYKKYPIKNLKIFWIVFTIFEIVLLLIFLPIITTGLDTFIQ